MGDSSNNSTQQGKALDAAYYQFCREVNRPYFGRVMWASQGLPLRHVLMQELVRVESARQGDRPLHILEVGSWAGGSAISWAEALTAYHHGNGSVVCVDPWKPYLDLSKLTDAPVYREMSDALVKDTIYDLFLHNVTASGYRHLVHPHRGQSTTILPTLPRSHFDIVFIDGDHSYAAVMADLKGAFDLIKEGAILCGDDLEMQRREIDEAYARTQLHSDYIRDPATGKEYHPGVTLAVGELIGAVSTAVGFWAVRKRGNGWEGLDMSQLACREEKIPRHLVPKNPGADPAFLEWVRSRASVNGDSASESHAGLDAANSSVAKQASVSAPPRRPQALLLQLEFQQWATARPWTYSGSFAIREGLIANGYDCVTVPVIAETPCVSPLSWVSHAQRCLEGRQFDQVWIWLVHTQLDSATLEWIAGLAPVRVGVLMESLRYEEEDYQWAPHLRQRQALVEQQIRYLTHVLAPDELDAEDLNARSVKPALWWPPVVCERYIAFPSDAPLYRSGVFHGTPYGPRQRWIEHPRLKDCLSFSKPPSPLTANQQLFDKLQDAAAQFLASGLPVSQTEIDLYAQKLQEIRAAEFADWMKHLPEWAAIVNLPSLARFYGGRVFEGMAAGRPVLSWAVPNHPRNTSLFEDEREILLFPKDNPDALADALHRVLKDTTFAHRIARAASRKLRRYHTAEYRIRQTLAWIEKGDAPDYGCASIVQADTVQASIQHVQNGVTPMSVSGESHRSTSAAKDEVQTNEFYTNLFVKSAYWSTPHPNPDESARWSKIAAFLEYILRRVRHQDPTRPLRILDVGCGRGWLTNLATMYGTCEGIEPVAGVIDHARRLFPHLRFEAVTAQSVLERPDFSPYDVVLCSEVIEHIPHEQKHVFVGELARLLKPDGYLLLTTPRGEMWEQWSKIAPPNQPIEDWVTEEQLRRLFISQGFCELGLERVHVEIPNLRYIPAPTPAELTTLKLLPIYQVWACQRITGAAVPSFTRRPMVSVIIPTCDRPERLREALSSVLAQTYQDFEIIVVNDGTSSIEAVIATLNSEGRITGINHDRNRGLAAARNTGLRAAKGKYVSYLDDDDRYLPGHLDTLATFLEHNKCKAAYTDAWRVHEKFENDRYTEIARDLPYSHDFNSANLLISNYFPVLCVMHARSCIEDIGFFDESLFVHEDWDLWIRMSTKYSFAHIQQTTAEFTWRTDGSSMTSSTREIFWRTAEIIYRKYRPHAERIPGVLDAQQQHLMNMRGRITPQTFDCSIVIPVCNKMELTVQCLTALARLPEQLHYEVIVVDNGSSDGTSEFLKQLGGDARIITNSENLGFAKACNQGARAARGRFLIFLNNDTIPLENWLAALVAEVTSHPEVGIVGSKLLYEDDTIQHAGVVFSRDGLMPYHLYRRFHRDHPAVNQRRIFQSVTAACMLIRREIFETAGGFDEGFQNGLEDVDLCLKVSDQGWQIVYQPLSVLYHLESQTPGRKTHEQANALRFLRRWGQRWWVADEDLYYYEDGYLSVHTKDGDKEQLELRPLQHDGEKASWRLVVETERAALRHDMPRLESLLARWDEWPPIADVLSWGAWLCARTGHAPLSRHFYQKLLQHHDDSTARRALARMALEEGNLSEADSHLGALLKRFPLDGEGWVLRGIFDMQQAQYAEAEQAFLTALAHEGDRRKSMMGLGMARVGQDECGRAWNDFCAVLNESPDDAEAIHWLLRAGAACGAWAELSERLQRFVSRNPADLSVRYALAGVFMRNGQTDAAQQEYRTLCTLAPSYEGLEELAKALAIHDTLAEIVPQS